MSVPKPDRKESKVEFDNAYFRLYSDAMRLISLNFGADKEQLEMHKHYIKVMSVHVLEVVNDIGKYIRIANSIYPIYKSELEQRRIAQDKAIGLCYELLTKYQLVMNYLYVKGDKYTIEIKNVIHEINCLKKWRTSDNKRFRDIG